MNDTPCSSATSSTWRLDKQYKFQLAFFRENLLSPPETPYVSVPPHNPGHKPEITNITLSNFLNLGFLPHIKAQSDEQNLYLKLFKFPEKILADQCSETILEKFLLTEMQQIEELKNFVTEAENIFVKVGWIEHKSNDFASRPFPKFLIPQDPGKAKEYILRYLPFSSLYVLPAQGADPSGLSDEQIIEHSYGGVVAFRKELFEIYSKKTCKKIETDDQNDMFVVEKPNPGISVITLKKIDYFKKPGESFEDFRKGFDNRPMPLGPNDFLSSLLLVDYTKYTPDKNGAPKVPLTKQDLDEEWNRDLQSNHILEIASIVRFEKIKSGWVGAFPFCWFFGRVR